MPSSWRDTDSKAIAYDPVLLASEPRLKLEPLVLFDELTNANVLSSNTWDEPTMSPEKRPALRIVPDARVRTLSPRLLRRLALLLSKLTEVSFKLHLVFGLEADEEDKEDELPSISMIKLSNQLDQGFGMNR